LCAHTIAVASTVEGIKNANAITNTTKSHILVATPRRLDEVQPRIDFNTSNTGLGFRTIGIKVFSLVRRSVCFSRNREGAVPT
ncbi:hypothetical protein, partial [Ruegeria arenilitoris]|uniref:hypothetical protein n=1 Tax=Ruegeria arenilitoris TaxID=1173585 RepID=UPI001C2B8D41